MASLRKMWTLLTQLQRRSAAILMGLVTIGMLVETLGVGLVMPAFALMTQRDVVVHYPCSSQYSTCSEILDRVDSLLAES